MSELNKKSFYKELEKEYLEEVNSLEEEEVVGAGIIYNPAGKLLSILGGNKGHVCTLTVECMPSCN